RQTSIQAWTIERQLSPLGLGRDSTSAVVRQIAAHWVHRWTQRTMSLGSSLCRHASAHVPQVLAHALVASIAARSCARSKVSFFGWVLRMSIFRPYAVRALTRRPRPGART